MAKVTLIYNGTRLSDVLVVPFEVDAQAEARAHQRWFQQEYLPAFKNGGHPPYHSLTQLLKSKGARHATEDEVEEVYQVG